MNEEQLIRLAEHAGIFTNKTSGELHGYKHSLQKFAELVRQDEREACAKVCENVVSNEGYVQAKYCAAAIRARGDKHD